MNDIVIHEITIPNVGLFGVFFTFFLLLMLILFVSNKWETVRPQITESNIFYWSALVLSLMLFLPAIGQLINILWDPQTSRLLQDDKRGYAVLLVAIVSAPLVVWRTVVAQIQSNTAAQGLITDRITKAIEQLGAEKTVWEGEKQYSRPNLEVRLGGIYALERIAQDSMRDHITVMEILCAYIRENSPAATANHFFDIFSDGFQSKTQKFDDWSASLLRPGIDIQVTLEVIGRRKLSHDKDGYRLDLRNCNLQKADFSDGTFDNALFAESVLDAAIMFGTKLNNASLFKASFVSTLLNNAEIMGTSMDETILIGTNFSFARTENVAIQSAWLEMSLNLTQVQVDKMFGSIATAMPEGLDRPAHWPVEELDHNEFLERWEAYKKANP